jgi:hypothetical protein
VKPHPDARLVVAASGQVADRLAALPPGPLLAAMPVTLAAVLGADPLADPPAGYAIADLAGPAWLRRDPEGIAPHRDLAVLLATSGSTGSPRFVRLSRAAITAIADVLGIGPDDVAPINLPLHYSYGMSVLNSHLLHGATVVIEDSGLPARSFWQAVTDYRSTSLAGVPHHYRLLRRLSFDPAAHPTLRTLTQAGGALAPDLIAEFHDAMAAVGGRLFVMYGQAEAAPRMATLPVDLLPTRLGSVGRALPGGRFSVRLPDRTETDRPVSARTAWWPCRPTTGHVVRRGRRPTHHGRGGQNAGRPPADARLGVRRARHRQPAATVQRQDRLPGTGGAMTRTLTASAFSHTVAERDAALTPALAALTEHHRVACQPYERILAALGIPRGQRYDRIADLPWLPVGLFKTHELRSVPSADVFRVLTSSGTTGAGASRIHLDRTAAADQTRHLARTLRAVLPQRRLPMLVVDSISVTAGSSARSAGVLGMAMFGRDHVYALDEHERPDLAAVKGFLAVYGNEPFLVFGFTFLIWQYLYLVATEHGLDLSNGILVHSGGWQKLTDRAVDNPEFRRRFAEDTGLTRIHDYYGMVEQIGTVFLEGPSGGSLYCPDFADVVIRDPHTWAEQPVGVPGVIEVVSTLPRSYPGHVLLTEDIGVLHGMDDGDWPGKRFAVLGRLPSTAVRGCSDTVTVRGER